MNTSSTQSVPVSPSKITWLMIVCGVLGAASIGAASAATTTDDVPSIAVKYDARSLGTDAGVHTLYRRLVTAAEAVCPQPASGSRFVSPLVQQCRQEAIARAVHVIDSPRLATIYASSTKRG